MIKENLKNQRTQTLPKLLIAPNSYSSESAVRTSCKTTVSPHSHGPVCQMGLWYNTKSSHVVTFQIVDYYPVFVVSGEYVVSPKQNTLYHPFTIFNYSFHFVCFVVSNNDCPSAIAGQYLVILHVDYFYSSCIELQLVLLLTFFIQR